MQFDHDEDGVSIDLSVEEAEDVCLFLWNKKTADAHHAADIKFGLYNVVKDNPRFQQLLQQKKDRHQHGSENETTG